MAQKEMKKSSNKQAIIVISVIVVVLLVIDLTFIGFLKFGYNVVRCGGVPVKVTSTEFLGYSIWYEDPLTYTPLGVQGIEYYCNQNELQKAHPQIQKKL